MTYIRNTYMNKSREKSCESCRFASITEEFRHFSDPRPPHAVHCHRHTAILNDANVWIFPEMGPGDGCSEWLADDGAQRGDRGEVLNLRCDTCEHSRNNGLRCALKPPTAISHEGQALFPCVGPGRWCGDHTLEDGVGRDSFSDIIPGFLRDLIAKARKAA